MLEKKGGDDSFRCEKRGPDFFSSKSRGAKTFSTEKIGGRANTFFLQKCNFSPFSIVFFIDGEPVFR